MNYLFLALLILGLLYIVGLPLYRKRPIVLTDRKIFVLILFAFGFAVSNFEIVWFLVIGVLALRPLLFYFVSFWITVGIEKVDLNAALQKALDGTLTKYEHTDQGVKLIDPGGEIKVRKFPPNVGFVTFSLSSKSAKQKLVKTVFQKFIDNYFFKI
jgi:hypothetical protein